MSPNFLVVDVQKLGEKQSEGAKEYKVKPDDEIIIKKNESSKKNKMKFNWLLFISVMEMIVV